MSEENYVRPGPQAQRLGKKIVGEENVRRATEDKRLGRNRFGKRVLDQIAADEAATAQQEKPKRRDGYLNLKELHEALSANADLLDSLIEAELAGSTEEEPPRKGAVRLFLEIEKAKGDAARPEVVAKLEPLA